jgi:CHAT domain-containing protein/Tfp pilus assembly protein PilF
MGCRQTMRLTLLLVSFLIATQRAWTQLKPGVVVEEVTKYSEAEKAGIEEADVLLNWSRGDAKGDIESPFDLSLIEIEQAPRGDVTLEGLRGSEKRTWTIGPDQWGIKARPNLPQAILPRYLEGQALAKAGKLNEAVKRWRAAGVEAQKSSSAWLNGWLFFHSGTELAEARQWKEADNSYQQAVQETVISPLVEAQLLRMWAGSYQQRNDLANAEKVYKQAATGAEKSGQEPSLLVALISSNLCDVLNTKGDYVKAQEYCDQALSIQQKVAPDSLSVASTLNFLAYVDINQGNMTAAQKNLDQAMAIVQKVAPGSLLEATTLYHMGMDANLTGDLTKAEDVLNRALALQKNLARVSVDFSNTLVMLGNVACDRGELAKAEADFLQALAVRQQLVPGAKPTGILNNLGNVAWQRGDLAKAEDYYRQVLTIRQKQQPDSIGVAYVLMNLGEVARDRGDHAAAITDLQQALTILLKLAPDSLDTANTYIDLGETAKDLREWDKAEQYYLQALKIREKQAPGSNEMSATLQDMGDVERNREDLVKAEEYYRRALEIREKNAPQSAMYAGSLFALANIMRRRQHPENALQLYEKAMMALESQSQVARFGDSDESRAHFRAKYEAYYKDYVDLLLAQNQPEAADQAFQVLERFHSRSLLEMLAAAHVDIRKGVEPALLEKERALQKAFEAKSQARIQLLSDKHTEKQLADLDEEIEDILKQSRDVEEQIQTSSPAYAALTQPQPLSAKDVQTGLLDSSTMLLEYSLGKDKSHLFALTPDSVVPYELPKQEEIEGLARKVHGLLTARSSSVHGETVLQKKKRLAKADREYEKVVASLGQLLLGPVAARLQGKRLLIVSDRGLQYIPFSILPDPANSSQSPLPLVAGHEIVNLPSASVLAALRRQEMEHKQPSKAVAVLADPVFSPQDTRVFAGIKPNYHQTQAEPDAGEIPTSDSEATLTRSVRDIGFLSLPRLPFTRQEANAIIAVTPPGAGLKAVDFKASRDLATSPQLANYRIVHLATHGLLDSEHPEFSGLVLSLVDKQGKRQNGFLGLGDIYNLNLPVEMVVLSACETGLGKEISGEGLIGLTRGFMYAGASRVVASLWSVDDVATAELMGRFYKGMLRQGLSPAAALRQAQIEMSKQKRWHNPYYWGAFVLQGEWKPVSRQGVN